MDKIHGFHRRKARRSWGRRRVSPYTDQGRSFGGPSRPGACADTVIALFRKQTVASRHDRMAYASDKHGTTYVRITRSRPADGDARVMRSHSPDSGGGRCAARDIMHEGPRIVPTVEGRSQGLSAEGTHSCLYGGFSVFAGTPSSTAAGGPLTFLVSYTHAKPPHVPKKGNKEPAGEFGRSSQLEGRPVNALGSGSEHVCIHLREGCCHALRRKARKNTCRAP